MNPSSHTAPLPSLSQNRLFYGDNLDVLREVIADESVDLVYLDPPFNSARDYNILFASPQGGQKSDAQITAFEDSWHWGPQAEREFGEIVRSSNTHMAQMMVALRKFMGENDLMAYLTMMANRLLELHRVLKPTGSLYLHCDPTASHYLKVVLDGVFGREHFKSEITWKRQSAHSDAVRKWPAVSDVLLFYGKTKQSLFKPQYVEHDPTYLRKFYRHDDDDGRGVYQLADMASPNPRPNMMYEWHGYPCPKKGWRYQQDTMQQLHDDGRIHYPTHSDGSPDVSKRLRLKRYLEEQSGSIVTNVWTDINALSAATAESLGYPTQKPLALLERIIAASSNEGDVVLDPFCGCGTAVHAAQKLKRQWIGIDITHLAVSLIEKRLKDAFAGIAFEVIGTPKDLEGARDLALRDKYQFQWWACSLVNAQPYQGKKKGADGGIDGLIFFQETTRAHQKIIVSVKGGENVGVAMVRELAHVVAREGADMGLLLTLAPATRPMITEALKEGYYTSAVTGKAFPKLQILSIEGLLEGRERALYPDLSQGATTFKKARREDPQAHQTSIFSS